MDKNRYYQGFRLCTFAMRLGEYVAWFGDEEKMKKYEDTNDLKSFANKLELLNVNKLYTPVFGMLPLANIGADIALKRFITLNNKVYFGAMNLAFAYKKEHMDLWGNTIQDTSLIRSMYFENAIESYNKVVDYVYLILYFYYKLYKILDDKKITSQNDIIELSRKIKGSKLKQIDKFLNKHSCESSKFVQEFQEYKRYTENMRNLANDIKHRGCIALNVVHVPTWGTAYKKVDGLEINFTEIVEPKVIDLDSEVIKLKSVHVETIDLLQSLYRLCKFEQILKEFFDKSINKQGTDT